jgi:hypothetical protein
MEGRMNTIDYNRIFYPHNVHRRYVKGCEECLARTKAAQARFTESRRRNKRLTFAPGRETT